MNPALCMPLSTVRSGRTVLLRRMTAGCEMTARLAAMGLTPGVSVHVYRNDRNGPVVLGLHGGRVMLGRRMAERVSVQETTDA